MAKKYNMRWTEQDQKALQRAVKTFNQKISRMEKRNPELKNALPEKVKMKEIKSLIKSRQDFKREINSLKRFSKKGNDEIITFGDYDTKITKWQKNEISLRLKVINRERKKKLDEINEFEMTQQGELLGYKKNQVGMGKAEKIELLPMKGLTPGMNNSDVKFKWRSILYQSQSGYLNLKDEKCKENYIKGLIDNFREQDVEKMIKKIKNMNTGEFIKIFYSDADAKFEGLYAPNQDDYYAYLEQLKNVWLK